MLPDIARIKNIGLNGLMYLTPVVYANPGQGIISEIMKWNPLSYILDILRNSLTGVPVEHTLFILAFVGITFVLFILSTILYRVITPIMIQRISA